MEMVAQKRGPTLPLSLTGTPLARISEYVTGTPLGTPLAHPTRVAHNVRFASELASDGLRDQTAALREYMVRAEWRR